MVKMFNELTSLHLKINEDYLNNLNSNAVANLRLR